MSSSSMSASSMNGPGSRIRSAGVPLRGVPDIGWRVPGLVVRAAVAIVAVLLCVLCYRSPFWLVVGLLLSGLAVVLPRLMAAWALMLFLAASLLPHDPTLSLRFVALLAGLHLLHVLAAQTVQLPCRCWVQVRALARPLLRFAVIQLPVQGMAVTVLLLVPRSGAAHRALPAFGVIGAVALVILALLLAAPLLRERTRG
jgi:hypothetical protein